MATPDPKQGAPSLASVTKEGGELAILVYREMTKPHKVINESLRAVTKRIPIRVLFRLCVVPTLIEYTMPRALLVFAANIVHLSEQREWTLKLLHNFDWYSCKYQHRQSVNEIVGWYDEFGFEGIRILDTNEVRKHSTTQLGRKLRTWAVEHNLLLKSTIGARGTRRR